MYSYSSKLFLFPVLVLLGCLMPLGCATTPHRPADADRYLNYIDENGLMLDGFDAVAMKTEGRLRRGSPSHHTSFAGGIYYFVSEDNLRRFTNDSTTFAPLFGGHCAMSASMGKVEPGDINTFSYAEAHLVLQRNDKALSMWNMDVCGNLHKAQTNWPRLVRERNSRMY